jgi:hypothetical protein
VTEIVDRVIEAAHLRQSKPALNINLDQCGLELGDAIEILDG